MHRQYDRQRQAGHQVNREVEMPPVRIVQSHSGRDQENHRARKKKAGFPVHSHLQSPANMAKPKISEKNADDRIQRAVRGLAPGRPSRKFAQLFTLLVDVPQTNSREKAEPHQENQKNERETAELRRSIGHCPAAP